MPKGQDIIVEKDDVDCRLSTWIIRNNKLLNFNSVNVLCRKGLIKVNGIRAKASYRLAAGDIISMPSPSSSPSDNKPNPNPNLGIPQLGGPPNSGVSQFGNLQIHPWR